MVKPSARLVLGSLVAVMYAASAQAEEIRIFNWSDYIDEAILKDFEAETGIKVVYQTFDTNELLETRLLAGSSGFDIVVPTATFLNRQIKAGVFQKLDKSKLPNLKNMWPEIQERVAVYDPGNEYSITYMWGTTGIGYNVEKVKQALPNAPVNSWALVYDPANLEKLSSCGVMMLDSAEDVLPSVMNYQGSKPDFTSEADIEKAGKLLETLAPNIRKFHSDEWKNALADGDICAAVGYSGDVFQMAARAEEAKNGVEIAYAIPKEGAQMFFDNLAIPADAKNVAEAHQLINYLYRPEVAARNSDFLSYANANLASQKLISAKVINDKTIYPDEATMKRLFVIAARDQAAQRIVNRVWTRVKTGR
jgi:putrescine transport system substrate-binding protein